MKSPSINSNAIRLAVIPTVVGIQPNHADSITHFVVIPAKAGIQLNQASGFRVKPGMTIDGYIPNTHAMKPAPGKKVEFA